VVKNSTTGLNSTTGEFAKVEALKLDITGTASSLWPKATGHAFQHHKEILHKYQKYSDNTSKKIGPKTHNRFSGNGLCSDKYRCLTVTNASISHIPARTGRTVKPVGEKDLSELLDKLVNGKSHVHLTNKVHKTFLHGGKIKHKGVVIHIIAAKDRIRSKALAGYLFDAWKLMALEKEPTSIRAVRAQADGKPIKLVSICVYPRHTDKRMVKNFCLGIDNAEMLANSTKRVASKKEYSKKEDLKKTNSTMENVKPKDENKKGKREAAPEANPEAAAKADADADAKDLPFRGFTPRIGVVEKPGLGGAQFGQMQDAPSQLHERNAEAKPEAEAFEELERRDPLAEADADPSLLSMMGDMGRNLVMEAPMMMLNSAFMKHSTKQQQDQGSGNGNAPAPPPGGSRKHLSERYAEPEAKHGKHTIWRKKGPKPIGSSADPPGATPVFGGRPQGGKGRAGLAKPNARGGRVPFADKHLAHHALNRGPELLTGAASVLHAASGFAPHNRGGAGAGAMGHGAQGFGGAGGYGAQGLERRSFKFGKIGALFKKKIKGYKGRKGANMRNVAPPPHNIMSSAHNMPYRQDVGGMGGMDMYGNPQDTKLSHKVVSNGGELLNGAGTVLQATQGFMGPRAGGAMGGAVGGVGGAAENFGASAASGIMRRDIPDARLSRRNLEARTAMMEREIAKREVDLLLRTNPHYKRFVAGAGKLLANVIRRDGTEISASDVKLWARDPRKHGFFKKLFRKVTHGLQKVAGMAKSVVSPTKRDVQLPERDGNLVARDLEDLLSGDLHDFLKRDGTEITPVDVVLMARDPTINSFFHNLERDVEHIVKAIVKRDGSSGGATSVAHAEILGSHVATAMRKHQKGMHEVAGHFISHRHGKNPAHYSQFPQFPNSSPFAPQFTARSLDERGFRKGPYVLQGYKKAYPAGESQQGATGNYGQDGSAGVSTPQFIAAMPPKPGAYLPPPKFALSERSAEASDNKKDEPKKDEPKKDEPKKDEPKKDEPKKDEPKKDESKKDEPKEPEKKESKDSKAPKPKSALCKAGRKVPIFGPVIGSGCRVARSLGYLEE